MSVRGRLIAAVLSLAALVAGAAWSPDGHAEARGAEDSVQATEPAGAAGSETHAALDADPGAPAGTAPDQAAAEQPAVQTYLHPGSTSGPFRMVVIGDSLAAGLYQGLYMNDRSANLFDIQNKARVNTGIVRTDRYNWMDGVKGYSTGDFDIAVVLLGLNDLQSIRGSGRARHFPTKEWQVAYEERVKEILAALKDRNIAIYWAGIPITAPQRYQEQYRFLNDIYERLMKEDGVKFVNLWAPLASEDGTYSPYFETSDGNLEKIRLDDGIHFTPAGYEIMARYVYNVIVSDVKQATAKATQSQ